MTDIVKSDWLYRHSLFSRKWKHEWFVLYLHGELKYYSSKESCVPEGIIHIRQDCVNIVTGPQCGGNVSSSPEGHSSEGLFRLDFRDGKQMLLSAETVDDMRTWQFALEQARVMRPPASREFSQAGTTYYPLPRQTGPVPMTAMTADGRPVPIYVANQPGIPPTYQLPPNATVYYNPANGQPIYVPPGTQQVIINHDHRGMYRPGFGTGMLAGAAVGSMMMGPLWWGWGGPGFWC